MTSPLLGATVRLEAPVLVRVPASSANLGPGFDAVGLALGICDEVEVTATAPRLGVDVEVEGEGAATVPRGEDHLVVRSLRTALARLGVREQPGLRLRCRNRVPHGRGLGSSATAIVSGVVAARAVLRDPHGSPQDDVDVASAIEGHPDNAAASVLGGMTLGWHDAGRWRAVRVEPHPDVTAVVCVPDASLSTARARAMLPDTVSHADAAFTAGRAALLVEAVTRSPDLLLPATADRLHQDFRTAAMPGSLALMRRLRDAGLAAVVSGAGPSVLVLTGAERACEVRGLSPGWTVLSPGIDLRGATATRVDRTEDTGSPGRAPVLQ